MAEVVKNGDQYYTLAYDPAGVKQDGRFHKIEVRLAQPGYKLLYRHGYVAPDAEGCGRRGSSSRIRNRALGRGVSFVRRRWSRERRRRRSFYSGIQTAVEEKQPTGF